MAEPLSEELTEAVYRAALEPAAWGDVMQLMGERFPSSAQTFYFLDLEPRLVRPVSLAGVEQRWIASFDELYFAADNPCIRLSERLHRPGVIRTSERLDHWLQDTGALYRSSYYNDWMRPQGFKYTIGTTLFAGDGVVANITLMRAPDRATFDGDEVRAFELLSRHMTRSLQMAVRLERAEHGVTGSAAFDALPDAIALLDEQRRVVYANASMESILRRQRGLALRQGVLHATQAKSEQPLVAHLAGVLSLAGEAARATEPLVLPCAEQAHLSLYAIPVRGTPGRYLPARPMVLLFVAESAGRRSVSGSLLRQMYDCTRSEARLVQCIVEGHALRQSADLMGITYGTARVYLKIVFEKAGVHSQAQLVSRVLADAGR